MTPVRIAHVIAGLNPGGAETVLYRLLSHLDRRAFEPVVINLTEGGAIGVNLRERGIEVLEMKMRPGVPDPLAMIRLSRLLRTERITAVQTWMYHADLVGGLAARAARLPVAWNIRHSNVSPDFNRRSTIYTVRACAHLSHRVPETIVCAADSTARLHEELGYDPSKLVVIPNGFDLEIFRPDPAARSAIREETGIAQDALVVGYVARFHPQKDHQTFVQAAAAIARQRPDARFLICGGQIGWDNPSLTGWIDEAGLRDRVHLLGRRGDIQKVHAALDIAILASQGGEAFPNTVAEAMACGVPPVVTDVGDARPIVGDPTLVVPIRDPDALAQATLRLIEAGSPARHALGLGCRRRIADHYSMELFVQRYQRHFEALVAGSERTAA